MTQEKSRDVHIMPQADLIMKDVFPSLPELFRVFCGASVGYVGP